MGLEALQWDNLVSIAEEAKSKYTNNKNPLGAGGCGEARGFIASRLYTQLGPKLFDRLVSLCFFKVKDNRGHFLIVVGGKKPDFKQTFEFGIKLDPTIYQFKNLHPELESLNQQVVFNGDYPKIYIPESLREDPYYPIERQAIKMRHKGYNI